MPIVFPSDPKDIADLRDRFWMNVRKQGECWIWQLSLAKAGYGQYTFKDQNYSAHRLAYFLHHGSIPDGKIVCHKCDNPACVNPDHLFAGTYLENNHDCKTKGRFKAGGGPKPIGQKLTRADVDIIRSEYAANPVRGKCAELARRFGIKLCSVSDILKGRSWAWTQE